MKLKLKYAPLVIALCIPFTVCAQQSQSASPINIAANDYPDEYYEAAGLPIPGKGGTGSKGATTSQSPPAQQAPTPNMSSPGPGAAPPSGNFGGMPPAAKSGQVVDSGGNLKIYKGTDSDNSTVYPPGLDSTNMAPPGGVQSAPPFSGGMPPGGSGMPPGGSGMPPGAGGMPPGGSGMPPGGSGMPPGGSGMPPGGSGMPPGY